MFNKEKGKPVTTQFKHNNKIRKYISIYLLKHTLNLIYIYIYILKINFRIFWKFLGPPPTTSQTWPVADAISPTYQLC